MGPRARSAAHRRQGQSSSRQAGQLARSNDDQQRPQDQTGEVRSDSERDVLVPSQCLLLPALTALAVMSMTPSALVPHLAPITIPFLAALGLGFSP